MIMCMIMIHMYDYVRNVSSLLMATNTIQFFNLVIPSVLAFFVGVIASLNVGTNYQHIFKYV